MTVEIAIANLNLCKLLSCLKLIQIKLLVKKNKRVYVFLRPSIVALELNDELLGNSFRLYDLQRFKREETFYWITVQ